MNDSIYNQVKQGYVHRMYHIPTGESWLILGVSKDNMIVGGTPPEVKRLEEFQVESLNVRRILREERWWRDEKFGGVRWK